MYLFWPVMELYYFFVEETLYYIKIVKDTLPANKERLHNKDRVGYQNLCTLEQNFTYSIGKLLVHQYQIKKTTLMSYLLQVIWMVHQYDPFSQ